MHFSIRLIHFLLSAVLLLSVRANDAGGDDDATWFDRIDVPLTFDSGGRYVAGVTMSKGPTRQNFSFTLSTGTGLTYVAGTGGNLSYGVHLYNESASDTAQLVSQNASADIFGQLADVSVVKETCGLSSTGGGLWEYENQTIFVINQLVTNLLAQAFHAQLGSEVSGIIGLGTNRASATESGTFKTGPADSIIGQWFNEYKNAPNFTFGIALNAPLVKPTYVNDTSSASYTAGSAAGTLHLMQPDQSVYAADTVKWVNANVSTSGSNTTLPQSDWTVILDGWTFATQNNEMTSKGHIVADIDPIYTGIYVPQDQATLMHAAIPGAALRKGLSTLGNLSEAWTLPCDSTFTFGLVIGGQSFLLDQSSMIVKQADGACVSAIEAWTNSFETQYLFGSRFMSTVYLIFNTPRDGVQSIGFANRTNEGGSSSPLDLKAIIGGAVGGAALLMITIFGIIFLRKYHNKSRQPPSAMMTDASYSDEPKTPLPGWQIDPFTLTSPTSVESYQARTQMSPTSSHHMLSPLPTSQPVTPSDRYSLSVAPPSYHPHQSYQADHVASPASPTMWPSSPKSAMS